MKYYTPYPQTNNKYYIDVTDDRSLVSALVKRRLEAKGSLIPINDVWNAAKAMEAASLVVTFDHHFKAVDGLRIW